MKKVSLILALVLMFASVFSYSTQAQNRISSHAKGAVIGGLGGAAAGALINKRNRVVGGAVGGVAGAGLGYAIGKNADNKRKAEAARVAAANRAEANRVAAARRAEAQRAAAYKSGLEQGSALAARNSAAPAGAAALTAGTGAGVMYTLNSNASQAAYAPTASGLSYLPNAAYGDRTSAYPSSEVRRKSW
ncbi:glycine zipper domain-containing protein [Hymenobacter tibetensis]|uniref:Glycine zipper domain-containing protein n=1 Tax=Hymenobacter tibetensis TaxID=497967 RepID=A0ABY4D3R3_9BACT|nr:YMGG-like glycine zipper-containing protein [Hymenobacter tibetensis]UOG75791.1 glycine zipper domain-containing protein [Hymenobacter tibetensis]